MHAHAFDQCRYYRLWISFSILPFGNRNRAQPSTALGFNASVGQIKCRMRARDDAIAVQRLDVCKLCLSLGRRLAETALQLSK